MTSVATAGAVRSHTHVPLAPSTKIRLALLGLGQVGGAVARLARAQAIAGCEFTLASALVRDPRRERTVEIGGLPLTTDPIAALDCDADVVVEALGGLEPARTLLLAALTRGIPVVTANKSLLAAHGDELFATAARTGTPLFYEASVVAGVPFLGTFGRRPLARSVTALSGIVNGTSNFILSRMATERLRFGDALGEAQRCGYAEPDPSKDVLGDDAVEKLCVLVRHFGGWSLEPRWIEKRGIADVDAADLEHAAEFGGVIRPVIAAEWNDQQVAAHAGPAFVRSGHQLAAVDGVQNGMTLRTLWSGDVFISGPGAGPIVTAATILDDVIEARTVGQGAVPVAGRQATACSAPDTGWFIRLTAPDLVDAQQTVGFLSALGIRIQRSSRLTARAGRQRQWLLTTACSRAHLEAALDLFKARTGADAWSVRVVE
jgi:homoserine dehydrogenase